MQILELLFQQQVIPLHSFTLRSNSSSALSLLARDFFPNSCTQLRKCQSDIWSRFEKPMCSFLVLLSLCQASVWQYNLTHHLSGLAITFTSYSFLCLQIFPLWYSVLLQFLPRPVLYDCNPKKGEAKFICLSLWSTQIFFFFVTPHLTTPLDQLVTTGVQEGHTQPDADGSWYIQLCSVATG